MRIGFCPLKISWRSEAITIIPSTQQSNAGTNISEISPAAHPGKSYQRDTIAPGGRKEADLYAFATKPRVQELAPGTRPSPQSAPQPQPAPSLLLQESHQNRELPGFVDDYYVYRKQQVPGDGRCGDCAIDTILHEFGIPPMKPEEFKPKSPDQGRTLSDLIELARKNGLKAKHYDVEDFIENRITSIENTKAFIILRPSLPGIFHYVALVRPDEKEGFLPTKDFHESDSYDQEKSKSKRYSGDTAQDALLEYETTNNVIAEAVLTFREIVSADGPGLMYDKGYALFNRSLWKEAIEAFDEVITRLCEANEPKQRVILAKARLNKGVALGQLGLWKEAIEAYDKVITHFEEATEPALCRLVAKAHRNRVRFQDKVSKPKHGPP